MKATTAVKVHSNFGVNGVSPTFACSVYVDGVGMAVSGSNVSNFMKVEELIRFLTGGEITSGQYCDYSEDVELVTADNIPLSVRIVVKLNGKVSGGSNELDYPSVRAFTLTSEEIGSLSDTTLFNKIGSIIVEQTQCNFEAISVIIDVGNGVNENV